MAITREDVEHVAALARLALSEEELERFTGQLSAILEHVSKLKAVDTTGVGPTASILELHDVLREDELRPGLSTEEAMKNAPDREGDLFRVQAVFDS